MGHTRGVEITSTAVDAALADAVELARQAAVTEGGADYVGTHLGVASEGELLAAHMFACTAPGYVGWRWTVILARASGQESVTVCDAVLLPGPEALVAPQWVPWSQRVRPGDLGPGDVLPTSAEDSRLVPGFTGADEAHDLDSVLAPPTWELGLGRPRVLSAFARLDAAERWEDGDFGPDSVMAKSAKEACASCGFMVTIGGALGQGFGLCANAMSPADGRVVSLAYGCGAHSETEIIEPELPAPMEPGFDHIAFDTVSLASVADYVEPEPEPEPEPVAEQEPASAPSEDADSGTDGIRRPHDVDGQVTTVEFDVIDEEFDDQ